MAKKNFPLLLSPSLASCVRLLGSPALGSLGLVCPVRRAESHPLPVPFPVSCEQVSCLGVQTWAAHTHQRRLSSGEGEGRHEAWVPARPSGRADSPWSCMGAGE